jgi:hypothetical protein
MVFQAGRSGARSRLYPGDLRQGVAATVHGDGVKGPGRKSRRFVPLH